MTLRWRELRKAYPRIFVGTALGIAVLLLTDLVLVYERARYGRELARMGAAMTQAEHRQVEAIAASEENRLALAAELARRQALGDTELHLAVDTANGVLYLERQGARLREMRVRLGPEAAVGMPPDVVILAPPLGKRSVARVVDGSYRWAVPEWLYLDRGLPVPGDRRLPGALGPLAIFLDSGAVLYSRPVRPAVAKTEAPAAIEHVLDELQRHGGALFTVEDLFQGRIHVRSTIDQRVQKVVNEALENGLARYEKRHPRASGLTQGSVVVLANADGAILAEAGGRQLYNLRSSRYSDYNRVTSSLRQPGSVMKPFVYLAAFRNGLTLDATVPDQPISVPDGAASDGVKWIANYDDTFEGQIPARQALAESRNAVAVWLAGTVGMEKVMSTCRDLGIHTPLNPYLSTALGASEVRLLELAGAYRGMASGVRAEPHVIARVTDSTNGLLYEAPGAAGVIPWESLALIQEGLRGVIRLPGGTAHALSAFPIPVMGKTGTTSEFRDALFVGSTYGPQGITVAVRIGFDDNHTLGRGETGARAALPIFREIVLRVYEDALVGTVPQFPREMESRIDAYLHRPRPMDRGQTID